MSAWRGQQPNELSPLLVNNAVRQQDGNNGCCAVRKWSLFYFFCFLSGQYVNVENTEERPSTKRKCVSVVGLILLIGQLFLHLSHVGIAMVVEGFRIGNVNITTNDDLVQCILPWKLSSAITISTIAAFWSYLFFVIILMSADGILCCSRCNNPRSMIGHACTRHRKAFKSLSPFDESTVLSAAEKLDFYSNYVVAHLLLVWFLCFAYYILLSYTLHDSCWIDALNITRIALHLSSQFCAIQSCFIFSKIVSKVTFKLNRLAVDFDQVDFPEQNHNIQVRNDAETSRLIQSNDKEKVARGRYRWLQKMDQEFIKQVKYTLGLFGVWFIFHWVLYTLTTVLLSASVIEFIINIAQFNIHSKESLALNVKPLRYSLLVVSVLAFTMVHLFLVFHPLCRAASIATDRTNLINIVSKKRWTNIPLSVQSNFVQYLTSENFTFQAPVFYTLAAVDIKWVYLTVLLIIISVALV